MKKLTLFIAAVAAFSMCVHAQEVKNGAIEVGHFSGATETYNGSYFDMAPTNFFVAHTGAQMIYTPDLLEDMAGKQNVTIKSLTFKLSSQSFEDITRKMKIYLQETDAEEFAVNGEGVKQFFEFDNLVQQMNYGISLLNCYYEDVEIKVPLTFDFTPGKSLLVTIVFDAQDDDNCTEGSDYAPFYTSGIRGKVMTYTNNTTSFVDYALGNDFPNATASLGCGTNVELPVTRIEYTYTEGGGGEIGQRGDTNLDGEVSVQDVTTLIDYLLTGEWPE